MRPETDRRRGVFLEKFFLALVVFLVPSFVSAEFRPIKFGYVDFPPLTYSNRGEPAGELVDSAAPILKKVGLTIASSDFVPAARLFNYMNEGKIEMWYGIELLPEHFVYTSKPLANIRLMIWSVCLNKLPEIKDVNDLKAYRLALRRGYGYGDWGEKIRARNSGFHWMDFSEAQQAFQFIDHDRADLYLDYLGPVERNLKPEQFKKLKGRLIRELNVKIGISKRYPNYEKLMDALNRAMR